MDEILDRGQNINKDLSKKWRHWHYKNTAFLVLSLVIFIFLADTPQVRGAIEYIGSFGYVGAFFVGILFVSVFTVAPASVVLFYLAENLNPVGVAIAAGIGGVVGDYLIFRYMKDQIFEELKPVFMDHGGRPLKKLFRTPYFAWFVPIVGAIIIMSPFPDEVGIGLMGVSKIKKWQLMGVLFVLDVIGIFLIVMAARAF